MSIMHALQCHLLGPSPVPELPHSAKRSQCQPLRYGPWLHRLQTMGCRHPGHAVASGRARSRSQTSTSVSSRGATWNSSMPTASAMSMLGTSSGDGPVDFGWRAPLLRQECTVRHATKVTNRTEQATAVAMPVLGPLDVTDSALACVALALIRMVVVLLVWLVKLALMLVFVTLVSGMVPIALVVVGVVHVVKLVWLELAHVVVVLMVVVGVVHVAELVWLELVNVVKTLVWLVEPVLVVVALVVVAIGHEQ